MAMESAKARGKDEETGEKALAREWAEERAEMAQAKAPDRQNEVGTGSSYFVALAGKRAPLQVDHWKGLLMLQDVT